MGEVVNRTWQVAALWQREMVWIRLNIGYIKAELPYLAANGHDVADIQQLVADFDPVFAMFCDEELVVFTSARRVESEILARADFAAKLRALANCFRPWLTKFDAVVKQRRAADDRSLPLGLLLGCGSELLNAHRAFAGTIDDYADEIDAQMNAE